MITVVTAVPGSGKTLYVVEMLDKMVNRIVAERDKADPDPVLLNRKIYHNIDGLDHSKFAAPEVLHPLPEGEDWRNTPDGSLVVYDEAWQYFPVTSKRDVDDPRLADLAVHRHTGHDIVFITQHPSQLHTFLRRLANIHVHLYRMFGLQASTTYTWQHVVDSPNSRSEQERSDKVVWKYPKKYYSWYKSATVHTHKFRLPKRIAYTLGLGVLVLGYFVWQAYNDENSIVFAAFRDEQPSTQHETVLAAEAPASVEETLLQPDAEVLPPDSPYLWTLNAQTPEVKGCVANPGKSWCACFGKDGNMLHMSHGACLSIVHKPLPRRII